MHKKNIYISIISLALASVTQFVSVMSYAAEVEAEFRTGFMTTDNLFQEPNNEIEDDIWLAGFSLDLTNETRRTVTEIRAAVDRLQYDVFPDANVIGGFNAEIEVALVEERLNWLFEDNFGQLLIDPLSSPTPLNLENTNFFSTGPRFRLPIGDRFFVAMEGTYSRVRYEESPNDNTRTSGQFGIGRRTGPDSSLSLVAATETIEYTEQDNLSAIDEYDLNEVFVAYELDSARNIVTLNIGFAELDLSFEQYDGPQLRADWTRIISPYSRFTLSGGSRYSSRADFFRTAQGNDRDIGEVIDATNNNSPFRYNYFYTRYNLDRSRTRIAVEIEWSQDDYIFESLDPIGPAEVLDRDSLLSRVAFERDLSRRFFARLRVGFRNTEYKYIDRKDDDFHATVTLGFRVTPAVNILLGMERFERDSNNALSSFEENSAFIGVAYIPAWGRR